MESIKLIEIPTYNLQQDHVRNRVDVGLQLRDKDYKVIAKDLIEKYSLSEPIVDLSIYSEYIRVKYKLNTDNNLLIKLNETLKS